MTSRVENPGNALSWKERLAHDVPASLVVFLVALPLCMGIALASGAPIVSGLIAGVVGGLVVGAFGGAPLLVSGPAAGLSVMVFGFIQQFGLAVTCAVVVGAGLLQVALGALKVARSALAISPAVIHGMLAGIGILIVLGQMHVVLGASPQSNAWQNLAALPRHLAQVSMPALVLGLLSLGVVVLWQKLPAGPLKQVPGALVGVVAATALAAVWRPQVAYVQLPENLFSSLSLPSLPEGGWVPFAVAVVSLAIVASAESLLSAVATDKLHTGARANLDRELLAQGLANTVSGMVGGLPVTGVIVRSATNINAGAKSRLSAFLHAVWMLLFLTLLGGVLGLVPLAVLAGLLLFVGAKLVDPNHIRELARRGELPVYLVTVGGVVGINLLAGIGLGLAVAVLRLLWRLGQVRVQVRHTGEVHQVHVGGALTFVGVPKLSSALAQVPSGAQVELDLAVESLDHSGYEALASWCQTHRKTGGKVWMQPLEEVWSRKGLPAGREAPPAPALPSAAPAGRLSSGGA